MGRAVDRLVGRALPETVRQGSLVVAQPRDLPDLTRFAQRTERFDWLDADGIAALEPDLAGRFRRALFFPRRPISIRGGPWRPWRSACRTGAS